MAALSEQQQQFFEDFGFLRLPGALKDDIGWIIEEFEAVFRDKGIVPDPARRVCIVPFPDQREKLCSLLDHPIINGVAESLLGEDWNYVGGDGNYYTGDTTWHTDGWHPQARYLKIAFYLDPVKRDSGALRVVPGSQRVNPDGSGEFRRVPKSNEAYGIAGPDVPAFALETTPGDLAVFNHNILHSAWGGNSCRRMFTLNLCAHATTSAQIQDLEDFVASGARFWIDQPIGEKMLRTASPQRMKHLQQVIDHSHHLPALAAHARQTMSEPARG